MFIVIVGGGICGLGAALLLARDGHDVTVLEHDADPVPASPLAAWDSWRRTGVAQFRQPHNFMPGLRLLLEAELPDVQDALGRAGACRFDLVNPLPPVFADRAPRPIDEKLWTFTARRPVGEWVFAAAAQGTPRVAIRRGVTVAGLRTGPSTAPGIPHVVGVHTADVD
jgi:2-polyprenyl-6-methoxyphenol hydroxylase-like FAD-dependent oxidoreductase